MTITTDNRARSQKPVLNGGSAQQADDTERVAWRVPTPGLWVAETPTAYLGMVDRSSDGFVATGSTGRDLGVFETLAEAQLAVYRTWSSPVPEPRAGWLFRAFTR